MNFSLLISSTSDWVSVSPKNNGELLLELGVEAAKLSSRFADVVMELSLLDDCDLDVSETGFFTERKQMQLYIPKPLLQKKLVQNYIQGI